MDIIQDSNKVFCIFNKNSEESTKHIEKAFELYLEDLTKTKANVLEKSTDKD